MKVQEIFEAKAYLGTHFRSVTKDGRGFPTGVLEPLFESDIEDLKIELFKVAEKYWEKNGAKIGSHQKCSDIKVERQLLPRSFDENTEFITKRAIIEPGAGNGHDMGCSLWVSKIKKDGSEGSEVRLATIILSKYNMRL